MWKEAIVAKYKVLSHHPYITYNVSVKNTTFITHNATLGRHVSTLSESSSDSERVETCRPKVAFYVIKLLCFLLF